MNINRTPALAVTATRAGISPSSVRFTPRRVLPSQAGNRVLRAMASFAMQDWLVGLYLTVLLACVVLGDGPRRPTAIGCMVVDSAVFWTCLLVARSRDREERSFAHDVLYRVTLLGAVVGSFFQLQYILPTVSDVAYDAQIYRLDVLVFGFEPAESWDRWVTPRTTEWFSFFYYSYFFILCLYVIPMSIFEARVRIMGEMTAGLLFVVCVGHCVYLLVPGYGPYSADHFHHPLTGPFWWPTVESAVSSVDGAARKDIFPSLHTACPTFLTLFSFRNRAHRPYRYVWPVTAFFTSQIILATMFLRWHYLLDVIAGVKGRIVPLEEMLSGGLALTEYTRQRTFLGVPARDGRVIYPPAVIDEPEPRRVRARRRRPRVVRLTSSASSYVARNLIRALDVRIRPNRGALLLAVSEV